MQQIWCFNKVIHFKSPSTNPQLGLPGDTKQTLLPLWILKGAKEIKQNAGGLEGQIAMEICNCGTLQSL